MHEKLSQEERGSVKVSELESDNKDVKRDSSDESNIEKLLDLLQPIGMLSIYMYHCCVTLS